MNNLSEITIEILGCECNARVEFEYSPGCVARVDALPEDCYPAEDEEYELLSLKIINDEGGEICVSGLLDDDHICELIIEILKELQVDPDQG